MNELNINIEFEKLQQHEKEVEQDIKKVDTQISFYLKFAWVLIGVGFVFGLFGIFCHFLPFDLKLNEFGDYTGGVVASTWSLAGLFIIYVAFLGQKQQILHQKMELKYNQFEVKATRKELEGQKEQMIEQNKTLKQQRFETTFFQMLNLHHKIVDTVEIIDQSSQKIYGRKGFKFVFDSFRSAVFSNPLTYDQIIQIYINQYENYQYSFSHYFRNLYRIIKFIDESDVDEKQRYSDILRAQLSPQEMLMIFYNGLTYYGDQKMKPLIEKYEILKNMPQRSLIEFDHKRKYKLTAFGEVEPI